MALDVPEKSHKLSVMLAEIRRTLRRQKLCRSATVQVSEAANGTIVEVIGSSGGGSSGSAPISAFQIAAVQDDYLQGNEIEWDEAGAQTISSDLTNIAKPESLRVSKLGAYTNVTSNARTVPIAGTPGMPENLKPPYLAGGVILAVKLSDRTPVLVGGETLEWEDLNNDGRNWFPPFVIDNVCVNGVPRRQILMGSAPFP